MRRRRLAVRRPRRRRPGSGWPSGSASGMPAARSRPGAGAERQDRLAVAILVLHEFQRRPVRGERATAVVAVRDDDGVEEHRRRRLDGASTSSGIAGSAARPHRARADEPRHRACGRQALARGRERLRRRTPSATRMATRRGRCCRRRVARTATATATSVTSGVTSSRATFGIGAGTSRSRDPSPPPRPAPARRSSAPTPSARGSPASAPATARSGRR